MLKAISKVYSKLGTLAGTSMIFGTVR
jgi:hypothetical protein